MKKYTVYIPDDIGKQMDDFCLKVCNRDGIVHSHLEQKVIREAVKEFLDNHGAEDPPTFKVVI